MTAFTHLQLKSRLRIGRPVSRRPLLIVMFIIVALASGALPSARGVTAESRPNEIRAASWLVGGNLSLAAMSYFRSIGSYESILDHAKTYASYIDVDIKPRPLSLQIQRTAFLRCWIISTREMVPASGLSSSASMARMPRLCTSPQFAICNCPFSTISILR